MDVVRRRELQVAIPPAPSRHFTGAKWMWSCRRWRLTSVNEGDRPVPRGLSTFLQLVYRFLPWG